jgi:DNA-binding response OmpR family regulator
MSVITGKNILLVECTLPQHQPLITELQNLGAHVARVSCEAAQSDNTLFDTLDLIIISLEKPCATCRDILMSLQKSTKNQSIPILAFVDKTEQKISEALILGAADYIVNDEDMTITLQKVKTSFGLPDTHAGVAVVDLTETGAHADASAGETKVFVVEDDPLLRSLLGAKFEVSNLQAEFSADGLDVIEKVRAYNPTVIVLDIMIGGVNGLDILESLKAQPDTAKIPVVIFSNQDSYQERERAEKHGANKFLVKATTDLSAFVAILRELSK